MLGRQPETGFEGRPAGVLSLKRNAPAAMQGRGRVKRAVVAGARVEARTFSEWHRTPLEAGD